MLTTSSISFLISDSRRLRHTRNTIGGILSSGMDISIVYRVWGKRRTRHLQVQLCQQFDLNQKERIRQKLERARNYSWKRKLVRENSRFRKLHREILHEGKLFFKPVGIWVDPIPSHTYTHLRCDPKFWNSWFGHPTPTRQNSPKHYRSHFWTFRKMTDSSESHSFVPKGRCVCMWAEGALTRV